MGLFKVSKDVVLNGITFKEIALEDEPMYKVYLERNYFTTHLWSMNFTYMYGFSASSTRKIIWKVIDDVLCNFILNNKGKVTMLTLPIGAEDKKQLNIVVAKCFKLMEKINGDKDGHIRDVNSLQMNELSTKHFKLKKSGFGQEHHYDVKLVSSLAGGDMSYIRRKVNKFIKQYPNIIFRPYEQSDWDKMMILKKKWEDTAGDKYFRIIDASYYKCMLKEKDDLNHLVFVAELDGQIIGMISGGYLSEDKKYAWCFLRKPLNEYDGLSEYLIHKLCLEVPEADVLNDGGDGGAGGLRFFKERFRPLHSPDMYSLYLNTKRKDK